MSPAAKPEERAAALVEARPRVAGGPWFVELKGHLEPPLLLGPYGNPSIAQEHAAKIKELLAAVIRDAAEGSGG